MYMQKTKSEYDKLYKLRKKGDIKPICILCGKPVPKKQSKYCDRLFIDGTRTYNKESCAYRARANKHLEYNKNRNEYFRKWSNNNNHTRPEVVYKSYLYNSNLTKRPFTISLDYFKKFWGKPCRYCDDDNGHNGVDRIDNKKGYENGNIVSCCTDCNFAKGHRFTPEQFINLCKKVSKNNEIKSKKKVSDLV
jgi:hypothetical protein